MSGPRSDRSPARGNGDATPALRVLLAHHATASTCDALALALEASLDHVEIVDAASIDGARHAVATEPIDVCLVCLDLPPAPLGGARLAQELVDAGHNVILVTRSLRWLPAHAASLRQLPWIAPEAGAQAVARVIAAARADTDSEIRLRPPIDELLEVPVA